MTYTIEKDFAFSAAHHLWGLPEGHQCARTHGHNYVVRVRLQGADLDPTGFVLDYGKLAPLGAFLDQVLDHQDLNVALPEQVPNPTAEHLAAYLAAVVGQLCAIPPGVVVSVGVSETPKSWAWFTP